MKPISAAALAVSLSLVFSGSRASWDGGGTGDAAPGREVVLHLREVEGELLAADVSHLSETQRAARAEVIQILAAYRDRGIFARNLVDSFRYTPTFVDADGRRCAVGHLLEATGNSALLGDLARDHNHQFVAELDDVDGYLDWLHKVGISPEEAARIEYPSNPPVYNKKLAEANKSAYAGPADGATPRAAGAPAPAAPGGPAVPSGPGPVTPGRFAAPFVAQPAPWQTWWNYQQVEFFRSEAETKPPRSSSDTRADGKGGIDLEAARARLLPRLLEDVKSPHATTREAALTALGRIGGKAAMDPLRAALHDDNLSVRIAAILGLGSTGASTAAHTLLHLAFHGNGEGLVEGTPWVRQLSIVALGLGRKRGFAATVDPVVEALFKSPWSSDAERAEIRKACLVFVALSRTKLLDSQILGVLRDESESVGVRARALETVGMANLHDCVPGLLALSGHARAELRRSAALALGRIDDPAAVAALVKMAEGDADEVARGYALASLGRHGEKAPAEVLERALAGGPKRLRPWASLGLGMRAWFSGGAGSETAPLLAALERENNISTRGAHSIALGLTRDPATARPLAALLDGASDDETRRLTSMGLALLRTSEARSRLLSHVADDASPAVKLAAEVGLGYVADPNDAPLLIARLDRSRDPFETRTRAVGLSLSRAPESLRALEEALAKPKIPRAAYEATILALALRLGGDPGLHLTLSQSGSNAELWDDWQTLVAYSVL